MPIKKDYLNKQFGCVIALEPSEKRAKNGSIIWKCKCLQCNSELFLSTKQLGAQKFQSCPNCAKILEIGKTYGQLTVEEYYPSTKVGHFWKCRCNCGNTTILSTAVLHSGHTSSCGCLQKKISSEQCIDMTGQIIGRWKVLKKSDTSTKSRGVKWLCECSCNKHTQREVSGAELRRGTSLSCGCLRMSHGEYKIAQLLAEANIPYETEKIFDTCIYTNTGNHARFDFWVNNEYLIEFDGIQHFPEQPNTFYGNVEDIQKKDVYKNNWCKNNNIPLIRIPYTHLTKLELKDLLLKTSKFIVN